MLQLLGGSDQVVLAMLTYTYLYLPMNPHYDVLLLVVSTQGISCCYLPLLMYKCRGIEDIYRYIGNWKYTYQERRARGTYWRGGPEPHQPPRRANSAPHSQRSIPTFDFSADLHPYPRPEYVLLTTDLPPTYLPRELGAYFYISPSNCKAYFATHYSPYYSSVASIMGRRGERRMRHRKASG